MDTMATIGELLKTDYLDGLSYQLNENFQPFFNAIEKTTKNIVNGEINLGVQYGRTGGVGNAADDAAMPTPSSRKIKQVTYETKNIFARIRITDKVIKATKSGKGAFVPMLENDLESAETDAKEMMSRQLFGDGTGYLGTVSGVATNTFSPGAGVIHLFAEGMRIDTYTSNGVTKHGADVEITAVDDSAETITVSAIGTIANGDYIYQAGNKDQELTGLKGVADNATLYGLTRTSYSFLNITTKPTVGEISETVMEWGVQQADAKSGAKTNFIMTSPGARRAYVDLIRATRSSVNTTEIKGGSKTVAFDNDGTLIPLVGDKYCLAGEMWLLSVDDWGLYQLDDWEWLDAANGVIVRVPGYAYYEAVLAKYADLGCRKLKGVVRLQGINEHNAA